MTPRIASQLGMVLLVSALAVLLLSIILSLQGGRSMGLAGLGTALLVTGIAIRLRARKVGELL